MMPGNMWQTAAVLLFEWNAMGGSLLDTPQAEHPSPLLLQVQPDSQRAAALRSRDAAEQLSGGAAGIQRG